jgi:AGCS family alanine or glycine:cation symporter
MSIDAAVGLIDGSFALMAIPTMISAIWLAPKVIAEAKNYWKELPNLKPN